MRLAAFGFAAIASLIATVAFATDATQSSNPQPPPGQQLAQTPPKADPHDPNKVICKEIEELGSRLGGEKVCMTRAQWNEEAGDNKQAIDEGQRRTTGIPGH